MLFSKDGKEMNDILYRQVPTEDNTVVMSTCVVCGEWISEDMAFKLIYCCPECYKIHKKINKDEKRKRQ